MNTDFHNIFQIDTDKIINPSKNITIGNNVWIGCDVNILKGSNIPANSVIGAFSIINCTLKESNSIYAGNLVKKVKSNINWSK